MRTKATPTKEQISGWRWHTWKSFGQNSRIDWLLPESVQCDVFRILYFPSFFFLFFSFPFLPFNYTIFLFFGRQIAALQTENAKLRSIICERDERNYELCLRFLRMKHCKNDIRTRFQDLENEYLQVGNFF